MIDGSHNILSAEPNGVDAVVPQAAIADISGGGATSAGEVSTQRDAPKPLDLVAVFTPPPRPSLRLTLYIAFVT